MSSETHLPGISLPSTMLNVAPHRSFCPAHGKSTHAPDTLSRHGYAEYPHGMAHSEASLPDALESARGVKSRGEQSQHKPGSGLSRLSGSGHEATNQLARGESLTQPRRYQSHGTGV